MNFLALFPVIMKVVNLISSIDLSRQSGESIINIVQKAGKEAVDLLVQVGAQLFPSLTQEEQVQAGALRFDAQLTSRIQTRLNELGASLDVDGHYGPATKAAVAAYQEKNGLDADGWAGPLTQAKLLADEPATQQRT